MVNDGGIEARSAAVKADVAVVIAAYNAAETVALAVASALAEPEVGEVWVVDDASTDDTVECASGADDGTGRLRIIRQAVNAGPSAARNVALAQTGLAWICVLDADDRFAAGRIGRLLAAAGDAELVADGITRVSSVDEQGSATWPRPPYEAERLGLAEFVMGNVTVKGRSREELGFIKPLMSVACLRAHGIDYDPSIRLGEDFLLYAQVLVNGGQLVLLPPLGYLALTRADSLSGRHSIDDLARLRDSTERLRSVRPLTPSEDRAIRFHWRSVDDRLQWRRLIDAVKTRNWGAAARTFHDPRASVHLAGQLMHQVLIRLGRLGGRGS